MNIDNLDKQILLELEKNAKIPLSQLSKKIQKNRETITYRINKLEKNKIIKNYITKINQNIFTTGTINLKLKIQYQKDQYQNNLIKLKNHKKINWIAETCGAYDITLTFLYKTPTDLSETLEEILNIFKNSLLKHSLLIITKEHFLQRTKIFNLHKPKEKISKKSNTTPNLDKNDIIILSELAKNAKIKNIELAKKTSLKEDAIRLRIKQLEKNNIILGYTITLNILSLNYEEYHINLNISNLTENQTKIQQFCKTNPNIIYSSKTSGEYNLIIALMTKNNQEFQKKLFELKNYFNNLIKNYEILIILKEHKEIYVPNYFIKK